MGDYEDRHRGGRGYNNRKRRYRDDEDYNHRPQRRRYEEPDHIKLRKQMLGLAESPVKRPEDEVVQIAKFAVEASSNDRVKTTLIDIVVELVVEQPFKIPFVAAVVLAANQQENDVVSAILEKVGALGHTALKKGSWRELKLILRFLACLQGLFEGDGIFPFLDELFDKAVELQTSSSDDALGLELVKIIQLTLPYVISSFAPGDITLATALLEKTDVITSTPHPLEALVTPYPGREERERTSFINILQKQLQNEAHKEWPLLCIPRAWKNIATVAEDSEFVPRKYAFPTMTPPDEMNPGPVPLFPDVFFSVYADQSVETVPPTSEIASCLLRDVVTDTINLLDFNRNATAKFLIDVDSYFAPGTFVKRATQFDKLKDVPEGQSKWKPEDVAVDGVFSQLFQLPNPQHKLVYYHSVLTEMCQVAPAAIAPSLGRAIRYLYKNIESMDLELEYRFMDWFAHHLSNFGFTWKWVEWVNDVELPKLHPKKAFMVGALEKEVRLSFASRIRDTLPAPYQPLIPKEKDQDVPEFKYSNPETPFSTEGRDLRTAIHKKAPDEEIQAILDGIASSATDQSLPDINLITTDAYITSICSIGAKSLSHVLSCIERSKTRLLDLGSSATATRSQIITSVMTFWTNQPGIGVNILDKLLNYTILTPLSVVDWVLSNPAGPQLLALPHCYEIVSATLGKVTNRVRQIIAARDAEGMEMKQIELLQDTLVREREVEVKLFKVVMEALEGVAKGEGAEDQEGDEVLFAVWAERWRNVFTRKFAVENAFVQERIANVPVGRIESNGNGVAKDDEEMEEDVDAEVDGV